MSNVARQILFIVTVFIFVSAITLVLFYGSGYQINWQSGDIETTSGITIVALPKTATVALPVQAITKTTPARFNQLAPGEYQVVVSAAGYQSQTLEITLASQAAMQFDPIQLWPEIITATVTTNAPATPAMADLPTTVVHNEPAAIYKNARTGQWLLQQSNSLFIYDPNAQTTKTVVRLAEPITAAAWHPNGWYVLYSTATHIHMIDSRIDYTSQDIVLTEADHATALRCASDGRVCYFDSANETYALSLR